VERILIIEDDDRIRHALRLMFEGEGFEVDAASSAEQGLAGFEQQAPSLAIIDLMLPGASGFEACATIRASSDIPVIIVSARDDTADVVKGLESGADDYVTKPFIPRELLARVRAHLRRRPNTNAAFNVGSVRVSPDEGTVTGADGTPIHLTSTEFRLIVELHNARGRVLSREHLLEHVWGYDYFGDGRLVDVHVRRLRTKIEPDPAEPVHVLTVRGTGYKLIP
jgi:YD repeat-containing protein